MALKATIVALALSSVDSFAPAATGASRRPAFAIIISPRCGRPTRRVRESHNAIAATPQFRAGFNTVTLTDCCKTTSAEGQAGATGGTFGMFSDPMTADDFVAKL